jgi:hypothetical protein
VLRDYGEEGDSVKEEGKRKKEKGIERMLTRLRVPFRYSVFVLPFSLLVVILELAPGAQSRDFSVVEATIADLQSAMQQKRVTSRVIVQQYLDRIR